MKHLVKIFIAAVMTALLLAGCGGNQEKLKGAWYHEGDTEPMYTLYGDGSCKIANSYGTGTWSVDGDQLKLTNYYGESAVATIEELSGEKLVLSYEGGSQTFWKEGASSAE